MKKRKKKKGKHLFAKWLIGSIIIGGVLGYLAGNIAVGLGLGLAIGGFIGLVASAG